MDQRVTITSKGKVSIRMSGNLKTFVKNLLELSIGEYRDINRAHLTYENAADKTKAILINEIYCNHFQQLSLIQGDLKLLLTLSQAHALWQMCQEYQQHAFACAEMGHVLLQLHQKLI